MKMSKNTKKRVKGGREKETQYRIEKEREDGEQE